MERTMEYGKRLLIVAVVCAAATSFADDSATSTWLPQGSQQGSIAPAVDAFLRPLDDRIRLLSCKYNGSKRAVAGTFTEGRLLSGENTWQSAVDARPAEDDRDALDLVVVNMTSSNRA